ncbi:MAG: restriction endonuclease subunit S [Bacteroidales bacterium]|jgi:type I restriction enzyme S subunit|nr:restriction endonuclease subunit S [Bacteroidales bacterium]
MTGQQLKNSILQLAIQGKLVPQIESEGTAEDLLKEIRAEKEKLVKEGKLKKKDLEVKPIEDDEFPFEIPSGWRWCRLIQTGITQTGATPSKTNPNYFGNFIPFVSPGDIQNGKINYREEGLSKEGYNVSRPAPKGTILQVCIGGSIGKLAITDKEVTFNQQINSVTPIFILSQFLYAVLGSSYFYLEITKNVAGSATPIINKSAWETKVIPLPPLSEQKRIVSKIEELMPLVEEYGKAQERLEALNRELPEKLKKSVLQEAIMGKLVPQDPKEGTAEELLAEIRKEKEKLVKEGKLKKKDLEIKPIEEDEIPFEIPESWKWCRLGEIGSWGSGATPAKGKPEYYTNGNIPWLRTGELNNDYVYDSEIKVTQAALDECSLRMCRKGDVLIAMYGATIGKVAIAGIELTTNQACCACTPLLIYNKYLMWYLMASKQAFIDLGEGGAQPNISREKIVAFPFALPPLPEQKRIVAKLEEVMEMIEGMK